MNKLVDIDLTAVFERCIADIADRVSAAGDDVQVLSALSLKFQGVLTDMFDELPRFVETDDDDLDFKGGNLVAPVSNETFAEIVDIHFRLYHSGVEYDEFIFTNALNELERRESAGDVEAGAIVARYDDLCKPNR
jgi:hypothetical protein